MGVFLFHLHCLFAYFCPHRFRLRHYLAMPFFLHATYFSKMENSYREMSAHAEEIIFQIGKLNHSTKKHANEVGRTEQNCEVGQHSIVTQQKKEHATVLFFLLGANLVAFWRTVSIALNVFDDLTSNVAASNLLNTKARRCINLKYQWTASGAHSIYTCYA